MVRVILITAEVSCSADWSGLACLHSSQNRFTTETEKSGESRVFDVANY